MTYALASGADGSTALRLGVAAGAAATLSPDTTRLAAQLGRASPA